MFRILGAVLAVSTLAGCATTKVADAYPDTWIKATSAPAGAIPATSISTAQPTSVAMAYMSPDRCYIVIEDKVPVVEICKEQDLIRYSNEAMLGGTSIIPPDITGVLVLQGHLAPAPAMSTLQVADTSKPVGTLF